VTVAGRAVQDRRISRISTQFTCHFTYEGVSREAVVLNISLTGALLSSKFMPPIGADVGLTLKPTASKETLKAEGKVIRGGWGISDHGVVGKFGVRFSRTPPQLLTVVTKLK
jgi:hypothetical protein